MVDIRNSDCFGRFRFQLACSVGSRQGGLCGARGEVAKGSRALVMEREMGGRVERVLVV